MNAHKSSDELGIYISAFAIVFIMFNFEEWVRSKFLKQVLNFEVSPLLN